MRYTILSTSFLVTLASTTLFAQQLSSNPPDEIHIDQRCRIVTQTPSTPVHPNPKPRAHYDRIVCHIEGPHRSYRWERITNSGISKRTYVAVVEREYLLQDVTDKPVTFVVDQHLPKGWRVDSEPQPSEITSTTATFRVLAHPTQTVRLHVGVRD